MTFRLFLILFMNCTLVVSLTAYAEVNVRVNNTDYTYSENPRLVDVLYPLALEEQWYWPQSKLFRSNSTNSLELRKQIIEMLNLASESDNEYKLINQNISKQINSWEVGDRINIKIDFEMARISAKDNPRFENGHYRLLLAKRPKHVYVFGAVTKTFNWPYKNNTCIEEIISEIEFSAFADKSYVYLISSQGKIEKSPIAYWNGKCSIASPGSTLYVPLQESLFSSTQNIINSKIAELAINRITIQ